jgi:hypothetical protein
MGSRVLVPLARACAATRITNAIDFRLAEIPLGQLLWLEVAYVCPTWVLGWKLGPQCGKSKYSGGTIKQWRLAQHNQVIRCGPKKE